MREAEVGLHWINEQARDSRDSKNPCITLRDAKNPRNQTDNTRVVLNERSRDSPSSDARDSRDSKNPRPTLGDAKNLLKPNQ